MNADEYKEFVQFDKNLSIGQEVVARWTNCNNYYAAKSKITKLKKVR